MEEIGLEKARATLGVMVDKARFTGEPTAITRQRKPAAVLVSEEWFRQISELKRFPLDMAQAKCPDCHADSYPDDLGEAVGWVLSHECADADLPGKERS